MKVAYEYCDYLIEQLVAIGDTEVIALDTNAQVEHFWSSGPCDPIESCGMGPRYIVKEIEDPPTWLIEGLYIYYHESEYTRDECVRFAVEIILRTSHHPYAADLRDLYYKTGKFANSLKEFFALRGFLSPKQRAAIDINHARRNRQAY